MHPSSGEEDLYESDDSLDVEINNKRKSVDTNTAPLKKIKYGDVTSEKPTKKQTKNEIYKPPTVEELNELKETEHLYNNNLFRLQIEELIKEVKVKNKHQKTFTTWYEKFQSILEELPEHGITTSELKVKNKKKLSETDQFINAITNNSIRCDQDVTLNLMKPEKCEVFGLASVNALPGPNLITNINLKMQRGYFNVKDYLNNRYFLKRYYFLAYIYYYLKKKDLGGEITWSFYNDNSLLQILQVKLSEKVIVRIFATPSENYFKPSRFGADINNIKTNVFSGDAITTAPTLFYNASMGHDVTLTTNHTFIHKTLSELPNAQEAIKLIYVWLTQRELNVGMGSFSEELILYFITYLFLKKRVNKHMSSYQIIRNFWNFINENDLTEKAITLADDLKDDVSATFQANYDVVFLDKTGYYNITSFLNVDIYKKLKSECAKAFKLLDDGINTFHSLFITKIPTELQYDLILNLESDSSFQNILDNIEDEARTKSLGQEQFFVVKYINDILHKAFNKRAFLIVPIRLNHQRCNKISFGINLDPSNAFNILELGPALNDPKEREFKEFWGDLATDRRFKDGSVCVAVYFKTETVKEKRDIVKSIINWVVTKKLELDYKLHYNEFEDVLINKKVTASYPMGTNEEASLRTIAASDDLGKKLRGLEMPLAITGVQGISDTLSLTDVFPPIAANYKCGNKVTTTLENNIVMNEKRIGVVPRYIKPIECVLQLEHSSKWPKDLETLRNMKTAFYLQISKLLNKKHNIVSSVRPEFFDVLHEGYVFRCQFYISREIGLLKKESINNGATVYKDTPESKEKEIKLNILPKVMGALKGLQAQYPCFGPTTALIKRWLRSQLIDSHHFPDEVINLLNASLFLTQSAFQLPSVPQIGFLRFLKFFTEFQWQIQTVVVNFNEEVTKEAIAEIDSKLLQNREAYPNLVILTPYDNCESSFTKSAPSKEVLRRVKHLAGETLNFAVKMIRDECLISVKSLFIPNLDGYDVIIHLRPLLNPVRHEQVIVDELEGQVVLKEFDPKESTKVPVTGFNPVQCYLKELRNNYGDFASFFHDSYGGNIIGVLWVPKALNPKDFKVSHINGQKIKGNDLVLNMEGIIEDFYILGQGLVKSIDKRK